MNECEDIVLSFDLLGWQNQSKKLCRGKIVAVNTTNSYYNPSGVGPSLRALHILTYTIL